MRWTSWLAFLCVVVFCSASVVEYSLVVTEVIGIPDGYPRTVIGVFDGANPSSSASQAFPGPTIRAALGDTLSITIRNMLSDRITSVHFHGVHMLNNAWMDGVAQLTECGIMPGQSFTYTFNVTQTGTYWYHAHAGLQVPAVSFSFSLSLSLSLFLSLSLSVSLCLPLCL